MRAVGGVDTATQYRQDPRPPVTADRAGTTRAKFGMGATAIVSTRTSGRIEATRAELHGLAPVLACGRAPLAHLCLPLGEQRRAPPASGSNRVILARETRQQR